MPATRISETEWEHIFKPIQKMGLPKAGFARNLPGTALICPAKFQGLSVMHPWYNKELTHLIRPALRPTPSPPLKLLLVTGEQLGLEPGLLSSFLEWPFDTISACLTDSWLKTMLQSFSCFDLALHDTLP
jgi:hypothetical protein